MSVKGQCIMCAERFSDDDPLCGECREEHEQELVSAVEERLEAKIRQAIDEAYLKLCQENRQRTDYERGQYDALEWLLEQIGDSHG